MVFVFLFLTSFRTISSRFIHPIRTLFIASCGHKPEKTLCGGCQPHSWCWRALGAAALGFLRELVTEEVLSEVGWGPSCRVPQCRSSNAVAASLMLRGSTVFLAWPQLLLTVPGN